MKVMIKVCTEKFFSGWMGHFWPQNGTSLNSRPALRIFKNFAEWKRLWDNVIFLYVFFTVWLGMVEIEPGHCYYWILKRSGHDFFHDHYWILKQSGHEFVRQKFMDIIWILCDVYVWRSKFSRGSYGFVKLL